MNEFFSDADCTRFLAARKNDGISGALKQMQKTYDWYFTELPTTKRGLTPANILYATRDDNVRKIPVGELLPHCLIGEDKNGYPIYWEKSGIISQKFGEAKKTNKVSDFVSMHIRTMELMTLRLKVQSDKHDKPIEKLLFVLDAAGLSLSIDFDIISYLRQFITIDQTYYAERLYKLIILNSPWYIGGIFNLVRPFIDPVSREKFVFVPAADALKVLREYINDDNIPVEYGGTFSDITWAGPFAESSGISESAVDAQLDSFRARFEKFTLLRSSQSGIGGGSDQPLPSAVAVAVAVEKEELPPDVSLSEVPIDGQLDLAKATVSATANATANEEETSVMMDASK